MAPSALSLRAVDLDSSQLDHAWLGNTLPVLVGQIDHAHRYVAVNGAYTEWFGLKPEEIIGRPIREIVGEAAYAVGLPHLERALRGETSGYQARVHYRTRGEGDVEVIYAPTAPRNEQRTVVVVVRDVTHVKDTERQLRESEERFALALRGTNDGIWDMDPRTDEMYFSPRYKEMLGYRDEELTNAISTAKALIHPEDWERACQNAARYLAQETKDYRNIYRMRHKNGEWRWIMCRGLALFDETGQATRFTGSHTDITETKLLEEELRQARDHSEAANVAKTEFLANMSHEIRTPMNAIIGLANILEGTQPMSEAQRKYITTLQLSAESLLALINDMLDIAKIEDNMIELERAPFSLREIVERVVGMMAVRAAEKRIDLSVEYAPDLADGLIGDALRIQQVLTNLVSNAIKFTDQGGVTLALSQRPGEGNGTVRLSMQVRDTGVGIPRDKFYAIFEKFTQADASITRRFGGTGLGLTICKALTERMGGHVHVASEEGQGAAFTVHLPLPVQVQPIAAKASDMPGETQSLPRPARCVLLVEDYEANILVATTLLETFGYAYEVARNGFEALEMVTRQPFDLILMDVQMQEMDGLEATRRIRAMEVERGKPRTPIFAMTAHALMGDREKCLQAGMDDYLSKPFNPTELQAKLVAALA